MTRASESNGTSSWGLKATSLESFWCLPFLVPMAHLYPFSFIIHSCLEHMAELLSICFCVGWQIGFGPLPPVLQEVRFVFWTRVESKGHWAFQCNSNKKKFSGSDFVRKTPGDKDFDSCHGRLWGYRHRHSRNKKDMNEGLRSCVHLLLCLQAEEVNCGIRCRGKDHTSPLWLARPHRALSLWRGFFQDHRPLPPRAAHYSPSHTFPAPRKICEPHTLEAGVIVQNQIKHSNPHQHPETHVGFWTWWDTKASTQ
jgi:hypothetical protein